MVEGPLQPQAHSIFCDLGILNLVFSLQLMRFKSHFSLYACIDYMCSTLQVSTQILGHQTIEGTKIVHKTVSGMEYLADLENRILG